MNPGWEGSEVHVPVKFKFMCWVGSGEGVPSLIYNDIKCEN